MARIRPLIHWVRFIELAKAGVCRFSAVIHGASIDFPDHVPVHVMRAPGDFSSFIPEARFRLIPTIREGSCTDVKAEEVVPIAERCDMGFLRTRLEPKLSLVTVRYCKKRLFRLSSGFAKNDER
uniref:Uncharacterized protein n=1 Tax=Candidatus Kentrum sp. TC TaxID=2126339 RepID=A0A450ZVM5_9GAMM|nr:MAG: hypothetical protein BECKTC1821F_GA0114240_102030 [Candidatus Kentron sp. TC]